MRRSNKKLHYYFDLWMSKGSGSMIFLLFLFTGVLVLVLGAVAWLVMKATGMSFGFSLWNTLLHTFDPGVIAGDGGSAAYLFVMLLATLVGMLFMALLIGFLNESITSKMSDLARGIEPVMESGHTVILGFNESTFIVLSELMIANENQSGKRNVVVIMDDYEKQDMEEKIQARFGNTGNLTVVCRSGSVFSLSDLQRCSITTCKAVVITREKDFDTIKSILACTQMMNEENLFQGYITAAINEKINERAARIAGQDTRSTDSEKQQMDRLELLMMEETISRIVTHTCRQPGLSNVFSELFNFSDNEFYIVNDEGDDRQLFSAMRGKTIREINRCLPNVIAVGTVDANGKVMIGDPNTVVLEENNKLIVLEADDDRIRFTDPIKASFNPPVEKYSNDPINVLITDCNTKLPLILEEMKYYLVKGSVIYIAADSDDLMKRVTDRHITDLVDIGVDVVVKEKYNIYSYDKLRELLKEAQPNYVIMLSSEEADGNKADEKSLRLLLYIQKYKRDHPEFDIGITCEMRNVENQTLAQGKISSDFIISRNIAALLMSQIAENRELKGVFDQILDSDGFEVYMKPAKYYLRNEGETEYMSVFEAVAEKHEILIGYMKDGVFVSNPDKTSMVTIGPDDSLIVLAEELAIID